MQLMSRAREGYEFMAGPPKVINKNNEVLEPFKVAFEEGANTSYALSSLQDGGQMFIAPGMDVYKGLGTPPSMCAREGLPLTFDQTKNKQVFTRDDRTREIEL